MAIPRLAVPSFACSDLLTTFGDGRVNLNTAPAPVLYALDEGFDEALIASIEQWRGKIAVAGQVGGGSFESAQALEQIKGVVETSIVNGQLQVTKNLFLNVKDRLTVQGKIFSARVAVCVDGRNRIAWGFLEAGNAVLPDMRVLAVEELEP